MKIKESIAWRVENKKKQDEPAYKEARDFVHKLGLKCDEVGWSYLDLLCPEQAQILAKIQALSKEKKLPLLCTYDKEISDFESEWYLLRPQGEIDFDSTAMEDYQVEGGICHLLTMKGYKAPKGHHVFGISRDDLAVSEDFKEACERRGFSGCRFLWIKDTGRYAAKPYYQLLAEHAVTRMTTVGFDLEKLRGSQRQEVFSQIDDGAGSLCELEKIFRYIQYLNLPVMVDPKGMPDSDFAYSCEDGYAFSCYIRKEAAEKLIKEKVLSFKDLIPIAYFDESRHSLLIRKNYNIAQIPEELLRIRELEKEKFYKKERPIYHITEKMALSFLWKAKRGRKEDFFGPLPKKTAETLENTSFEPLIPYYRVSNGGALSDEVWLFAYEEMAFQSELFRTSLEKEELLAAEMPELFDAMAVGKTLNGDMILLMADGRLMRFDHEDPALSKTWETPELFFYETVEI